MTKTLVEQQYDAYLRREEVSGAAQEFFATPLEINSARQICGVLPIQIDADAIVARNPDGSVWVEAWVKLVPATASTEAPFGLAES